METAQEHEARAVLDRGRHRARRSQDQLSILNYQLSVTLWATVVKKQLKSVTQGLLGKENKPKVRRAQQTAEQREVRLA